MTQMFMAAALFLLAAARIPALLRNRTDLVFSCAVYGCIGSLLMSPVVYVPVDTALGGMNLVKLALNSLIIIALWYLRLAAFAAIAPEAGVRRSWWTRTLPLTLTLTLQTAFFFLTGPTATTTTWGMYEDRFPALLFSLMLTLFICSMSAEIAVICFRYVPRMSPSFRIGFSMLGAGCIMGFLVMAEMCLSLLSRHLTFLAVLARPDFPYHELELAATVLAGAGLTIPAVAGRAARRKLHRWNTETLARVKSIWAKALQSTSLDRTLETEPQAPVQDRLHRMIVEIWDAELAAGTSATFLTPEERSYLLSVEAELHISPARA
ncbi:hypothetical protein ACFVTM_20565 [Arthrobacter sp. NPDC058130]|uniref:hypothetical protein n=1 Tax=Arthrobacter sp. NPDC058130 TaxID=3346353 RepID=UPI0036E6C62A